MIPEGECMHADNNKDNYATVLEKVDTEIQVS